MSTKILLSSVLIISQITIFQACKNSTKENDMANNEMKKLVTELEQKVIPLSKSVNQAYFNASVTGKMEDYQKAADIELILSKIYGSKQIFEQLKKLKQENNVSDELLNRQLHILYNDFIRKQIDTVKIEKLINMSTTIEQKFSTYRTNLNNKEVTDNDIENILQTSTKSKEVKDAWLASKKIGVAVASDIISIVKLRNELAKELGYSNFHAMELQLGEQDPKQVEQVFDELDSLTRDAFADLKGDIDSALAIKFNIPKEQLMPWHYQNRFFQEAPKIYAVEYDDYYLGKDVLKIVSQYYKCIGINIDPIIKNSDMYEKPGKNQHAFCSNIDKKGDVRILCNLKNNSYWMATLLHEFGHGIYDMYIDTALPFFLRDPSHTFTTEAIAMMFGRFSSNPQWLHDVVGISTTEQNKIKDACVKSLRLQQLVFSRWAQVMYRFEKSMYENPDQDLNTLWWQLVEKYQMIKKPTGRNEPDWASKIHLATAPCYYHNYLLGELLASQIYYYIVKNVIKSDDYKNQSFANKPAVGNYLIEKVFNPGNRWEWNTMIKNATGEHLTAKYYASQFVK